MQKTLLFFITFLVSYIPFSVGAATITINQIILPNLSEKGSSYRITTEINDQKGDQHQLHFEFKKDADLRWIFGVRLEGVQGLTNKAFITFHEDGSRKKINGLETDKIQIMLDLDGDPSNGSQEISLALNNLRCLNEDFSYETID